jgi:hypothetical protein
MYFDAVLTPSMRRIAFNGTDVETRAWLLDNPDAWHTGFLVARGSSLTIMTVEQYLEQIK